MRQPAIESMKRVYSSGYLTLALDSELLLLDYKLCKKEELQLRVGLLGWMRRCWTFQEAVIAAGKLHVQFNDGTYNLAEDLCHLRACNDIGRYMQEDAKSHKNSDIAFKGLAFGLQAFLLYQGKMESHPNDSG